MRVVVETLCQRRSWLVAIGFVGAPAALMLAFWHYGGDTSHGRPVSAAHCRPSVLRRTAVVAESAGWDVPTAICSDAVATPLLTRCGHARVVGEVAHPAEDDRGPPESAADITHPAPSAEPRDREPSPDAEPDAAPLRFEDLAIRFRQNCAACHGDDGTGDIVRMKLSTIPDFTNLAWQFSQTEDVIIDRIADGSAPLMPPFRDTLSPQEIMELAIYVRSFIGRAKIDADESVTGASADRRQSAVVTHADVVPNDEPSPAPTADVASRIRAGAGIFRQYCVACHGADGTGRKSRTQAPSIPDFTNDTWQTQHTDRKLVASIMDGKGTLMPANRRRITDEQARDVVAYLRSFGPRAARTKGQASRSEFEKSFRELERRWDELENRLQQNKPQKNKR